MFTALVLTPLLLGQSNSIYPVAFEREGKVFIVNSPGAKRAELTEGTLPSVSPDGRKVAFVVTDKEGNQNVQVVALSQPETIFKPVNLPKGKVFQPSWSPDSTFVTFEHRFPEEGRTLYIWKAREEHALGLFNVTDEEEDMRPGFNSDGQKIGFLWKQLYCQIDVKKGGLERMPLDPLMDGLPQGSKITHIRAIRGNPDQLVYSVEAGDFQVVFLYQIEKKTVSRISPVGLKATMPEQTPDPRKITYWGTDKAGETWLYSIMLNGRDESKVLKRDELLP